MEEEGCDDLRRATVKAVTSAVITHTAHVLLCGKVLIKGVGFGNTGFAHMVSCGWSVKQDSIEEIKNKI